VGEEGKKNLCREMVKQMHEDVKRLGSSKTASVKEEKEGTKTAVTSGCRDPTFIENIKKKATELFGKNKIQSGGKQRVPKKKNLYQREEVEKKRGKGCTSRWRSDPEKNKRFKGEKRSPKHCRRRSKVSQDIPVKK